MAFVEIHKKIWYTTILNGLIHARDYTGSGLTVCMETDGVRLFTEFDTHVDFGRYVFNFFGSQQQNFYEIIGGSSFQKLKFDIDIKDCPDLEEKGQKIFDYLIESMIEVFPRVFTDGRRLNLEKDILVFTSHSENKRSFHVVVDNYYVENCHVARMFYDEVMENVPEDLKKYIDPSVYSSRQQFRVLGSQKWGSGRPKTFQRTWRYGDESIYHRFEESEEDEWEEDEWGKFFIELSRSLVSNIAGCVHASPIPSYKPDPRRYFDELDDDLSKDLARQSLDITISVFGGNFPYHWPGGIVGGIVILKRKRKAFCPICKREHEHENAFLSVREDEREENKLRIFFHCRRAESGLLIGTIDNNPEEEIEINVVEKVQNNWRVIPKDPVPVETAAQYALKELFKKQQRKSRKNESKLP